MGGTRLYYYCTKCGIVTSGGLCESCARCPDPRLRENNGRLIDGFNMLNDDIGQAFDCDPNEDEEVISGYVRCPVIL